jgi:hypothetical protein
VEDETLLDEIICEIPEKFIQWRVTVNTFRGQEYLHFRKYFLSYEGEYCPSSEGACIPVNIQRISNLFSALLKIMSDAEALEAVLEHLDEETVSKLLTGIERVG